MRKKLVNFLCLFALLISITSCSSGKLDREEAAILVKEFYGYPNIEVRNFFLDNIFGNPLESLINQGYIYINKSQSWNWVNSPTKEGKKYQCKNNPSYFATNTREFKEITGIVYLDEKDSKARIEFSCIPTNITPFGKFLGIQEGQIQTYALEAMRYDDGWRITSPKEIYFKSKDFQYAIELEYQAKGEKLWIDFFILVSNSIKQRDLKKLFSLSDPDSSQFNAQETYGIAAIEFFRQNLESEQWKLLDNALNSEIIQKDNKKYFDQLVFEFKNEKWYIYGLIGE
jgi:hypothetical protein